MPPKKRAPSETRSHTKGFFNRHGNVYLYTPNIIGYARIICLLYAVAIALHDPTHCCLAYFISFVCDELDGRAARTFNQSSTFGAVLDMVTDRVGTSCLLAILCMFYPTLHTLWLSILMLDIFSHWFQMYATLASGSATHKDIHSSSFIVRYYYQHRLFMGFCCICVEVFLLSFYLLRWPQYRSASYGAATLGLPLAVAAALDNVPVLKELLINYAGLEGNAVPVVAVIALVVLPGAAIKQFINVVQFRTAADQLAALDSNNKGDNKKSTTTTTGTGTRRGRSA